MKTIGIHKIKPTNPNVRAYEKVIKFWDEDEFFSIREEDNYKPFYAIYLGDIFLAASTIEFDKESSVANIALVNGSRANHEFINKEATKKLTDIAKEEYGVESNKVLVKCL